LIESGFLINGTVNEDKGGFMPEVRDRRRAGALIAIEGIDGAGKSTQAKMLCRHLSDDGYETVYLREPTDGPIGRRIRELANQGRDFLSPEEEFRLFLEDRREDVEKNIRPALESGRVVVIDRYFYSSIAYQGALGLDPEMINCENRAIAITPDLMIYLAIPADISPSRIETSRGDQANLFENLDNLRRVRERFEAMDYPEIVRVDGTGPVERVHETIYRLARKAITAKEGEQSAENVT